MLNRFLGKEKDYRLILMGIVIGVSLIKILIMCIFSSDYQNIMFRPFVQCFLNGNKNPYEYYYENNLIYSFPYPPLMLWIESIGGILIDFFQVTNVYVCNFLFKLPLLVCDLLMLYFLIHICGRKRKYILILYFVSPIVIYSTYMHGQLDIIPTMFLVMSFYYLTKAGGKKEVVYFILALTAALMTKFHIAAVIPMMLWYLYKKKGWKVSLCSALGIMCLSALVLFPYLGEAFLNLVLFNREQATITNVYLDYQNVKLYLPVFAVVVIYLHILQLNNMNRTLLSSVIGIIFSVFLIFVPPMPGWFVWIVPFVLLYFVEINENRYRVLMQYALFCIVYLIYFIFMHDMKYVDLYFGTTSLAFLKYSNELVRNMFFTMLAAILFLIIISMYRFGIQKNTIYKRNNLPFILGIAGDSGTGKTELLNSIETLLDAKKILYIEGDGDHRWERGNKNWEQYTHLDPKANCLYRQAKDLQILRTGNAVRRADYDHDTGKFTQEHRINPKPYIIMCGLHSLYLPQMRKNLDLKIFLDTDENLRRFWKIKRDTVHRGYTGEEIIAQIEKRIPDANKYIYPQKKYADLIIRYFDASLKDCLDTAHEVVLSLQLTVGIECDLEELLTEFEKQGLKIEHSYDEDLKHQTVIFDGVSFYNTKLDYHKLASDYIEQMDDMFSSALNWDEGIAGMVQFFVVWLICERIRGD